MNYYDENKYCTICSHKGVALHHIIPRGMGGNHEEWKDEPWNLIPVCFRHHEIWHRKTNQYMATTYREVRQWLLKNGWTLEEEIYRKKWRHPGANKDE